MASYHSNYDIGTIILTHEGECNNVQVAENIASNMSVTISSISVENNNNKNENNYAGNCVSVANIQNVSNKDLPQEKCFESEYVKDLGKSLKMSRSKYEFTNTCDVDSQLQCGSVIEQKDILFNEGNTPEVMKQSSTVELLPRARTFVVGEQINLSTENVCDEPANLSPKVLHLFKEPFDVKNITTQSRFELETCKEVSEVFTNLTDLTDKSEVHKVNNGSGCVNFQQTEVGTKQTSNTHETPSVISIVSSPSMDSWRSSNTQTSKKARSEVLTISSSNSFFQVSSTPGMGFSNKPTNLDSVERQPSVIQLPMLDPVTITPSVTQLSVVDPVTVTPSVTQLSVVDPVTVTPSVMQMPVLDSTFLRAEMMKLLPDLLKELKGDLQIALGNSITEEKTDTIATDLSATSPVTPPTLTISKVSTVTQSVLDPVGGFKRVFPTSQAICDDNNHKQTRIEDSTPALKEASLGASFEMNAANQSHLKSRVLTISTVDESEEVEKNNNFLLSKRRFMDKDNSENAHLTATRQVVSSSLLREFQIKPITRPAQTSTNLLLPNDSITTTTQVVPCSSMSCLKSADFKTLTSVARTHCSSNIVSPNFSHNQSKNGAKAVIPSEVKESSKANSSSIISQFANSKSEPAVKMPHPSSIKQHVRNHVNLPKDTLTSSQSISLHTDKSSVGSQQTCSCAQMQTDVASLTRSETHKRRTFGKSESLLNKTIILKNCVANVDEICESFDMGNELLYKVRWCSYTWETEKDIFSSELRYLLDEFNMKNNNMSPSRNHGTQASKKSFDGFIYQTDNKTNDKRITPIDGDITDINQDSIATELTVLNQNSIDTELAIADKDSIDTELPIADKDSIDTELTVSNQNSIDTELAIADKDSIDTGLAIADKDSIDTELTVPNQNSIDTELAIADKDSIDTGLTVPNQNSIDTELAIADKDLIGTEMTIVEQDVQQEILISVKSDDLIQSNSEDNFQKSETDEQISDEAMKEVLKNYIRLPPILSNIVGNKNATVKEFDFVELLVKEKEVIHASDVQETKWCACLECGARLTTKELQKHNRIFRKYVCPQCGVRICNKKKLKQHVLRHVKSMYQCSLCFKSFQHNIILDEHRKKHRDLEKGRTSNQNPCHQKSVSWRSQYKRGFFKKTIWKKHMLKHRQLISRTTNSVVCCQICRKGFRSNQTRDAHVVLHQVMPRQFTANLKMEDGDDSSHQSKTLNTKITNKETASSPNGLSNTRSTAISIQKRYAGGKWESKHCIHCLKGFHNRDSFVEHVNAKECRNLKDNGQCILCKQYSSSLENLKEHIINCFKCSLTSLLRPKAKSDGEDEIEPKRMVYHCSKCSAMFLSVGLLRSHRKLLHAQAKCYQCTTCGYKCLNKRLLCKHLNKKQCPVVTYYRCFVCDGNREQYPGYSSLLALVDHLQTHKIKFAGKEIKRIPELPEPGRRSEQRIPEPPGLGRFSEQKIPGLGRLSEQRIPEPSGRLSDQSTSNYQSIMPAKIESDSGKCIMLSLSLDHVKFLDGKSALCEVPGFGMCEVNVTGTLPEACFSAKRIDFQKSVVEHVSAIKEKTKNKRVLTCSYCLRCFPAKRDIMVHFKKDHKWRFIQLVVCKHCNAVFREKSDYTKHMESHNDTYAINTDQIKRVSSAVQSGHIQSKDALINDANQTDGRHEQEKLAETESLSLTVDQQVLANKMLTPKKSTPAKMSASRKGVVNTSDPKLPSIPVDAPSSFIKYIPKKCDCVECGSGTSGGCTQTASGKYACHKCSLRLVCQVAYTSHLSYEHQHAHAYVCNICNQPFLQATQFKQHTSEVHPKAGLNLKLVKLDTPCYICSEVISPHDLSSHVTTHASSILECYLCSVKTSSLLRLQKHLSDVHRRNWTEKEDIWYKKISSGLEILHNLFKRQSSQSCNVEQCSKCKAVFIYRGTLTLHECSTTFKDETVTGDQLIEIPAKQKKASSVGRSRRLTKKTKTSTSKPASKAHGSMALLSSDQIVASTLSPKSMTRRAEQKPTSLIQDTKKDIESALNIKTLPFDLVIPHYLPYKEEKVFEKKRNIFHCQLCFAVYESELDAKSHVSEIHLHNTPVAAVHDLQLNLYAASSTDVSYAQGKVSSKVTIYHCNKCPLQYLDELSCWKHVFTHLNGKVYRCSMCSQAFGFVEELRFHYIFHKCLVCWICHKTFHTVDELSDHSQLHVLEANIPRDANGKMVIEIEMNTNWKKKVQNLFPAEKHPQPQFAITCKISQDILEDTRLFFCHICRKNIEGELTYIVHIKTHAQPRRFCCLICKKTCSKREKFEIHFGKHFREEELLLELDDNIENESDVENDDEEQILKCSVCLQVFETIEDQKLHQEKYRTSVYKISELQRAQHITSYVKRYDREKRGEPPSVLDIEWSIAQEKDFSRLYVLVDYSLNMRHPPVYANHLKCCLFCQLSFPSTYLADKHILMHGCTDEVKCLFCSYQGSSDSLFDHTARDHLERFEKCLPMCPVCYVMFGDHQRAWNAKRDGKYLRVVDHIKRHFRDLPLQPFKKRQLVYCVYCYEKLESSKMYRHMSKMHSNDKATTHATVPYHVVDFIMAAKENATGKDSFNDDSPVAASQTQDSSTVVAESQLTSRRPTGCVIAKQSESIQFKVSAAAVSIEGNRLVTNINKQSVDVVDGKSVGKNARLEDKSSKNHKYNDITFSSTLDFSGSEKKRLYNSYAAEMMSGLVQPVCSICHWKFLSFHELKNHLVKHFRCSNGHINPASRDAVCAFCRVRIKKTSMNAHVQRTHPKEAKRHEKMLSKGNDPGLQSDLRTEEIITDDYFEGRRRHFDDYNSSLVNASTKPEWHINHPEYRKHSCSNDVSFESENVVTVKTQSARQSIKTNDGSKLTESLIRPTNSKAICNTETLSEFKAVRTTGQEQKPREATSMAGNDTANITPYPHTCRFCLKGYILRSTLLNHIKASHPRLYQDEQKNWELEKKQKRFERKRKVEENKSIRTKKIKTLKNKTADKNMVDLKKDNQLSFTERIENKLKQKIKRSPRTPGFTKPRKIIRPGQPPISFKKTVKVNRSTNNENATEKENKIQSSQRETKIVTSNDAEKRGKTRRYPRERKKKPEQLSKSIKNDLIDTVIELKVNKHPVASQRKIESLQAESDSKSNSDSEEIEEETEEEVLMSTSDDDDSKSVSMTIDGNHYEGRLCDGDDVTTNITQSSKAFRNALSCVHCSLAFPCHTELASHLTVHLTPSQQDRYFSVPYPYNCVYCGVGYYQTGALKQHLQGRHKLLYKPDLEKDESFVNEAVGLQVDYEKSIRTTSSAVVLPKRDRSKFQSVLARVKKGGVVNPNIGDKSSEEKRNKQLSGKNQCTSDGPELKKIKRSGFQEKNNNIRKKTQAKKGNWEESSSCKEDSSERRSDDESEKTGTESGLEESPSESNDSTEEEKEDSSTETESIEKINSSSLKTKNNNEFVCHLCDLILFTGRNLKNHVKAHTKNMPNAAESAQLICICCKQMVFRHELKWHMHTKHQNMDDFRLSSAKTYCMKCNYSSKKRIEDHLAAEHPELLLVECRLCDARFSTQERYKQHFTDTHGKTIDEDTLECFLCNKTLPSLSRLHYHYSIVHMKKDETLYCLLCSKFFYSQTHLGKHREEYHKNDKFQCGLCLMEFDQVLGCEIHVQTHKITTQYRCTQCRFYFENKEVLENHETTHNISKTLICTTCRHEFDNLKDLQKHEGTHSTEPKAKWSCSLYLYEAQSEDGFLKHQEEHSVQRNYHCASCDKTFRDFVAIQTHMNEKHNGGVPTPLQQTTNVEEYSHSDGNPTMNECKVCGEKFLRSDIYLEHIKKHS